MSNPSALALHDHQQHRTPPPPPPPPSSVPPLTPSPSPSPSPSTSLTRDYRKGNWTLHETLILISAKRLDDDRRRTTALCSGSAASPRAAELRWKWVENYCWKNGCQRSQNQCNDKWDNLLRDYKKVRDYAATAAASGGPTYWTMEKSERKDRGLPSNLSSEVFEALSDVLSRRNAHRGSAARTPTPTPPAPAPQLTIAPPPPPPPQTTIAPPPMLPPPPLPPAEYTLHPSPSAEASDSSECSGSSAKRRRVRGVGRSVARASSVLARTLLACEERRDKRHRDRIVLEERRLRLEEEQAEINRQGIAGLIAAVNGLSGAIQTLVADHRRGTSGR